MLVKSQPGTFLKEEIMNIWTQPCRYPHCECLGKDVPGYPELCNSDYIEESNKKGSIRDVLKREKRSKKAA
jgi:hypothetical protein